MPGLALNPNAWNLEYLWHWTDPIERADVYLLGLLVGYVLYIVVRTSHRCRCVRSTANDAGRIRLAAQLSRWTRNVNAIGSAAPYFGLVGACAGILETFRGFDMERHAAQVMLASILTAALIPTAAGILAAVLSVCSHNYLVARIESLEIERLGTAWPSHGSLPGKRAMRMPAFGLVAVPVLSMMLLTSLTFASFSSGPVGLEVGLVKVGAIGEGRPPSGPFIAVVCSDRGRAEAYVDSAKTAWSELEAAIRTRRTRDAGSFAYVGAEKDALWADVARAIDAAKGDSGDVVLLTTTPESLFDKGGSSPRAKRRRTGANGSSPLQR